MERMTRFRAMLLLLIFGVGLIGEGLQRRSGEVD